MSEMIDISKEPSGVFFHRLADAAKGDRIVYWQGQFCGGPHRRDAAKAETDKLAFLFCRRSGPGFFDYIAVKR